MTLNELKESLKTVLLSEGFEKIKNKFYKKCEDFLCKIAVQKSAYGDVCYINYDFYFGDFIKPYNINHSDLNSTPLYLYGRFEFDEKNEICEYLNINQKTLTELLIKNLEEKIYPPFIMGKTYFIKNMGRLYNALLEDKVIKFLNVTANDITFFRREQMLDYYSDGNIFSTYSILEGLVVGKDVGNVLMIDVSTKVPANWRCFCLNENRTQKFAFFSNPEIWERVLIGDIIKFASSSKVFYDCPYPIVMLEKDGVKFLEFEKGKKDYLEWIEKTFPINKD